MSDEAFSLEATERLLRDLASVWRKEVAKVEAKHKDEYDRLHKMFLDAEEDVEELCAALSSIKQWADAYPLEVFPEPDLVKARKLLEAGGMTLDAISASAIRHAIEGVGKIAKDALEVSD